MANFVKHIPCPACGSKDNRAIYDDDSEYCFGCHTFKAGVHKSNQSFERDCATQICDLTTELPEENLAWLRKYLTDDQISQFFYYSPSLKRHVYIEIGNDDKIQYWEARRVDSVGTKVISSGPKPCHFWGKWKETGVVVLVEDIVSAIKLSDYVGVICLHGSVITQKIFSLLGNSAGIKQLIIWMDCDKLSEAGKYQRKFEAYGKKCSMIRTEHDPKAHTKEEILEILGDSV